MATPVQNMGINHRGFHVFVTEQFLDGSNAPAILKRGTRKRRKARRPPGPCSAQEGIGIVGAPSIVPDVGYGL